MQHLEPLLSHLTGPSEPTERSSKDPFAPWVSSRTPGVLKGTHRVTGQVKWRVRYRPTVDSAQTSRTFDTLEAAKRFRNQQQERAQDRREGRERPAPKHTDRFEVWAVEKYLPVQLNDNTVKAYGQMLERIRSCDPEFLELPLGMIRKVDLERLMARLARAKHSQHAGGFKTGYAPRTINTTMAFVVAVMNHAVENEHIAPFGFKLDRLAPGPGKPTPDHEQLLAVIEATEPWYRTLVACTAILGLRSGEARGLTVERVDGVVHSLREGWLYSPDPFAWEVRVHRQLSHDGRRMLPVKGSRHREVFPDEAALQVIVDHLNRYGLGPDTGEGHLVFQRHDPSGVPGGALPSNVYTEVVARASRRAGLSSTFSPHAMRRYHVTTRLAAGEQVRQVADDVGHADTSLTERVYNALQRRRRVRGQAFSAVADAAAAAGMPPAERVTRLTRAKEV